VVEGISPLATTLWKARYTHWQAPFCTLLGEDDRHTIRRSANDGDQHSNAREPSERKGDQRTWIFGYIPFDILSKQGQGLRSLPFSLSGA